MNTSTNTKSYFRAASILILTVGTWMFGVAYGNLESEQKSEMLLIRLQWLEHEKRIANEHSNSREKSQHMPYVD